MSSHSFARLFAALWAVGLLLHVGCSSAPSLEPVHPVSGAVRVKGQPAAGVMVVFHRQGGPAEQRSYAKTGADGTFALTTRETNDGAPLGDYVITLLWPPTEDEEQPNLRDKLGERYKDPARSQFKFTVQAGENIVSPFEIP